MCYINEQYIYVLQASIYNVHAWRILYRNHFYELYAQKIKRRKIIFEEVLKNSERNRQTDSGGGYQTVFPRSLPASCGDLKVTTSADQFTCRSTTRKESTVAQCEILHTMYAYTVHVRLARKKIARILYIYQTKKMIMIISCVQSTCI